MKGYNYMQTYGNFILFLLHTNATLHSNVNAAGANDNFREKVHEVPSLDHHQHLSSMNNLSHKHPLLSYIIKNVNLSDFENQCASCESTAAFLQLS